MLSIKQGFAGLPGGLADAQDPECGEATDAGYAKTRLDRLKFGVPPSGRCLRTWENQATDVNVLNPLPSHGNLLPPNLLL